MQMDSNSICREKIQLYYKIKDLAKLFLLCSLNYYNLKFSQHSSNSSSNRTIK